MVVIIRYIDEVKEMKDFAKKKGKTYKWIGEKIGCSGSEVGMWFNRSRSFPEDRKAQIKELLDTLK